jgi:hypothetical protein
MKRIPIPSHCAFVLALLSLCLQTSVALALDNQETRAKCGCYTALDMCPAGQKCDPQHWNCDADGKLDSECVTPPAPTPKADALSLASALDLYVEAYMVPLTNADGGRPDFSAFDAAFHTNLGAQNQRMHGLLQDAVHRTLDAVVGFDFQNPEAANRKQCLRPARRGAVQPLFGNIRAVAPEAADLVEAAHEGLRNGILTRNLNAVVQPLTDFWTSHPDFHPLHTGRYYDHGHADYAGTVGTPLNGQIVVLKQSLAELLNDGDPLCGNDVREGSEACDGTDNSGCGGVCALDCTCGVIL